MLAINSRFSFTDNFVAIAVSCGETLMIFFTDFGFLTILFPSNCASPLVGSSKQDNILIVVVFPAPFVPSNAKNSPSLMVKLRVCTAILFLYFFVRFFLLFLFILLPFYLVCQTPFDLDSYKFIFSY